MYAAASLSILATAASAAFASFSSRSAKADWALPHAVAAASASLRSSRFAFFSSSIGSLILKSGTMMLLCIQLPMSQPVLNAPTTARAVPAIPPSAPCTLPKTPGNFVQPCAAAAEFFISAFAFCKRPDISSICCFVASIPAALSADVMEIFISLRAIFSGSFRVSVPTFARR